MRAKPTDIGPQIAFSLETAQQARSFRLGRRRRRVRLFLGRVVVQSPPLIILNKPTIVFLRRTALSHGSRFYQSSHFALATSRRVTCSTGFGQPRFIYSVTRSLNEN